MASGKRARDGEDSDEEMASDAPSPALSSSAPTDEPEQPVKRLQLDGSSSDSSAAEQSIQCVLPPHPEMTFATYNAYEVHYEQHHLHRCTECHKNFPSDHYMQLHIAENHDPIIAVRRERGERTVCQPFPETIPYLTLHTDPVGSSSPASWKTAIACVQTRRNVACI